MSRILGERGEKTTTSRQGKREKRWNVSRIDVLLLSDIDPLRCVEYGCLFSSETSPRYIRLSYLHRFLIMSSGRVRSVSSDSSSSSTTTASSRVNDSSNLLYNDRQHYQVIFNNDSRFFDTSLHLLRSYRQEGYLQLTTEKKKRRLFGSSKTPSHTLKARSNGLNGLWRTQQAGFSSNSNINGTMKPPFARNHGTEKRCALVCHLWPSFLRLDHSISYRSDPGTSKSLNPQSKREQTPQMRQSNPAPYPPPHEDSSDEGDIIVTRL